MLTEFQKHKLPRLFALHDLNADGVLARSDFDEFARRIAATRGWESDSEQYRELRSRLLTFWDGLDDVARSMESAQVTRATWFEYWARPLGERERYEQVAAPIGRVLFTMLDRDGDGSVTADESAALYAQGGLDPHDAVETFARLDLDPDGRLSVDEVMQQAERFGPLGAPNRRGARPDAFLDTEKDFYAFAPEAP